MPHSRTWLVLFAAIMAAAMAASTIAVNSLGVLASSLIADLDLSRTEIGGLVTAYGVVAAVLSAPAGHYVDRIGGRRALMAMFLLSGIALVGLATSPGYAVLAAAMMLAGLATSAVNPGTNLLISAHLPPGERGVTVGVKMSGVQLGVLTAGLVLPLGTSTIGWRPTVALLALIPTFGLLGLWRILPSDDTSRRTSASAPVPRPVWVLAVYSLLMGAGTRATITYVPLYAQETLGLTQAGGGLAVAILGLTAVFGRVLWGRWTERSRSPWTALVAVGLGAVGAIGLLLAADAVAVWILWPAAIAIGVTSASYNSVTTVAMLGLVPSRGVGRASGIIFTGFLSGLAVGALLFGALVDATDTYTWAWLATSAAFAAGAAVIVFVFRRMVSSPSPAASDPLS